MNKSTFKRLASERLLQPHDGKLWHQLPDGFVSHAMDMVRFYDVPQLDFWKEPVAYVTQSVLSMFRSQQINLDELGTSVRVEAAESSKRKVFLPGVLVSPAWQTGGDLQEVSWRSRKSRVVEAEPEPEFLEDFLEEVHPEIAYLQLRAFRKRCLVVTYRRTEEYEGSYEYAFKMLSLQEHMLGVFHD